MNAPSPNPPGSIDPVDRTHALTIRTVAAPSTPAANDPAVPDDGENTYFNPMWIVAGGGAVIFATMAAVMALG